MKIDWLFGGQPKQRAHTPEMSVDIRKEIENQGHVIRIFPLQLLNAFEMKPASEMEPYDRNKTFLKSSKA